MTQPDPVSIEMAGLPSGRLPKELFGVTLVYRIEQYPDWPKGNVKMQKKRQHFLFTKRSSQQALLKQLAKLNVLDEQEVFELHGRIEWDSVKVAEIEEAA